ncbi:heavy metal translocating P-type ATPase [Vreelandella malpeensis]|uniref:Cadmium-translocating P-type ATPase n=1 Tax=Vreelandella malpeensis TaxID=1172368 RepID=A0ABS8DP06_9GAMM|nr:heavy metal translocating P-type ATPase [Halomonas malpeensis]MCB8888022.1 cadmium-translocating P-type ATPase [Halomonas malpeensis]
MSAPCYHCGTPVPDGAPWRIVIDETPEPLCCPGCEAVAHAIVEGGLANYYRYRTELSPRPAVDEARPQTWAAFDHPDLQAQFVHAGDGQASATLAVENITCAACAWLIEHRLNALAGITQSAVNLAEHRLRVSWDPTVLSPSRIFAELAAIGYDALPFEPDSAYRRQQREERMTVRRLIVAAVGMMQVVMFSIPLYVAGPGELDAGMNALFHWLSLALTTPVVLFSARPFFREAGRALFHRRLTMEVPVALAIGGAYLASLYAVLARHGEVYFDSIAMFTFFLLFSRYLEARTRRKSGQSGNALAGALPAAALRLDADGHEQVVPASHLKRGDRILVKPGASVPADGVIEQGESSLDESMLTGEHLPVTRRPGERVTGASHNMENALTVRVTQAGGETTISAILEVTDRAFAARPALARLAERMAHRFVLRLLLVSLLVALAWSVIDPGRAFWVTLSVLVVTCPCALALAAPTALAAGHGQLKRRGVLITRADTLEALAGITHVVFDKTGTLTRGEMRLKATLAVDDTLEAPRARAIAAALEAHSEHTIATAFRPFKTPALAAERVTRHPGFGLEASLEGAIWRLGRASFAAGHELTPPEGPGLWLLLSEDGAPRAWFALEDFPREDALETVARLKAQGLSVELLSGDTASAVERLAEALGISRWQAEATPEGKLDRLRALQAEGARVLMVGDGINDVPVLAGADVAIAMNGATDLARTRADALLLSPRLMRVSEAVEIARATRQVMRQNMAWSVAYNAVALPLAALGLVAPWLAALGMSLSSLVVVGNALRLTRRRVNA